ncbi:MAG: hypothetical protein DWQ37_12870 [Planctomycetota bacterium]|nr:MAG: hypothetical protein DWQ37_12870 [Planctomycetota bacterium]
MTHPLLRAIACGIVLGLLAAELSTWPRLTLRRLCAATALVACLCGLVWFAMQGSTYAAAQAAYGGQRYTRAEAEAIRGANLDSLPDSEFR